MKRGEAARLTVVLYTRASCHLCDEAKAELARLQLQISFDVEERDVEADREWQARYGEEVPVGVVNGSKVFKYRVDSDHLRRSLEARMPPS